MNHFAATVLVVLCCLLPAPVAWSVEEGAAPLEVGASMRVITPDPLLPVSGGLGKPSPVREKRGELTARAIVLRQGDTRVAIVSLDLIGFPQVLGDRVRAEVPHIPARPCRTSVFI